MFFLEKRFGKLLFGKKTNIIRNTYKTKLSRDNTAKRTNFKKNFQKKNQEIQIFQDVEKKKLIVFKKIKKFN